ncbi:uncharacterized protein METZ01_LOCUS474963, partial [marine metagenome]
MPFSKADPPITAGQFALVGGHSALHAAVVVLGTSG